MRPAALPTAASLLALALLVAACGGSAGSTSGPAGAATDVPATEAPATEAPDDAAPTPGTTLTACEIVTAADVQAATGATDVADGTPKQTPTSLSPGHNVCTYEGEWGRIIVSLTPEDGANLYDAARGAYDDASDIAGDWDGAFNSNGKNRAFVWKGAVTAMFTMFVSNAEQADVATSLAKAVVGRL